VVKIEAARNEQTDPPHDRCRDSGSRPYRLTPQSVNVMGGYKVQGKSLLASSSSCGRNGAGPRRRGFFSCSNAFRVKWQHDHGEVQTPRSASAPAGLRRQVLVIHDLLNLTFGPREVRASLR